MPANDSFDHDVLKHLLEEAGFEDVQLRIFLSMWCP